MMILAGALGILILAALLTGFLKFGEPDPGDRTPIRLFRIDNTYSLHIRNVGGFSFVTWFSIVFVGPDGDTVTRLYGWENPNPRLDPPIVQK